MIGYEIDSVRAQTLRPFAATLIPAATDPVLLRGELKVCVDREGPTLCSIWDVVPAAVAKADVSIVPVVEAGGDVHGTVAAMTLVEQVVWATSLPIHRSSGFATGASLIAALTLGAQPIRCRPALLATQRSFAQYDHKACAVDAMAADAVHTDTLPTATDPFATIVSVAQAALAGLTGMMS